jgi:hypothetical protein
MNPVVTEYIEGQPEAVRPLLRDLREMIVAAYPQAEEGMYNGQFPVYLIDGDWAAAFASRSKGPMLYVMDQGVVEIYRERLGKLVDGKACVLYKPGKAIPAAQLKQLASEMLLEAAARRGS